MRPQERTDVLVVGAGPVGMLTALLLAKEGIQVRIIDQESRTASRTYACALHPRTLALLDRLGLARDILEAGQRIDTVAFYEGKSRRAEVKLSQLQTKFPYVMVVAQSNLEKLLEDRLKQEGRVQVSWNHQLSALRAEGTSALAVIDKLAESAKGYIVPEMEWSVEKTEEVRAAYVVGADGPKSHAAKSLGLTSETVGGTEFFAVYEFQSDITIGNELRLVLDQGTTSVLWPLAGNKFRWSFQLLEEHLLEFPAKERSSLMIGDPNLDQANLDFVRKLVRERAPWFEGTIQEVGWSTDVEFAHRVAARFGQGPCWLVGDAAHQTGPAGMQSMNLGLAEAEQLAGALSGVLKRKGSNDLLEGYGERCRADWRRLLGLQGVLKSSPKTDPWIKEHKSRILTCLPASGDELAQLLAQLELTQT